MGKVFTITEGLENLGALRTGGQGSVYKGRRIGEIFVAIKLLPTPVHAESEDDKNFRSFKNEVEKLKKVNEIPTPHVVKILNSGITESGSLPFIEMEFIDGPDLGELLNEPHDPVFTIHESIKVANQLAQALAHCHTVSVNHGDIKSNNVKFNLHTGNYVLLDFGLAVMSDEQRRSSLRNAGAVEFMAPEQSEGTLLPQSDIYSYGIILYELLAGRVPFPLINNGQTAFNSVMVEHAETPVPDVLELRRQNIPQLWPAEKQEQEMQVPGWLLQIVARCLEKKPADRFADGTALHEALLARHEGQASKGNTEDMLILQNDNVQLKAAVAQERDTVYHQQQQINQLKLALSQNEDERIALTNSSALSPAVKTGGLSKAVVSGICLVALCIGAFAGRLLFSGSTAVNSTPPGAAPAQQQTAKPTEQTQLVKPSRKKQPGVQQTDTSRAIAAVKDTGKKVVEKVPVAVTPTDSVKPVSAERKGKDAGKIFTLFNSYAYFHDEPNAASVRKANINRWNNARLKAIDDIDGYIYVIYKNEKGQVSKGWLNKKDLIMVGE